MELSASAVINGDLDFLDDHHDSGDVAELVLKVGLTEDVVEVVGETVVDLVDDEDLVDLLYDSLLEAVVDDLKVLLLDLEDLLLLVELVEVVQEVKALAVEAVHDSTVEAIATEDVVTLRYRGTDGLSSLKMSVCTPKVHSLSNLTSETSRERKVSNSLERHCNVRGPVNTEGVDEKVRN